MEQQYFLPTVVCLKAKNNGYIVQDADFRITRKLKRGVWRNIITEDSIWANPFICKSEEEKADCIQKFEAYIRKAINDNPQVYFPELYRMVTMGRPATLGCFCKKTGNEACHGDTIVKIAGEFIQLLKENKIPKAYLVAKATPSTILTSNFVENINLPNQNQIQKMELPYGTITVRGITPSDSSRLIIVQVDDPDIGKFDISLFLTAGAVPENIIHTQFGQGGQGKEYNNQKHNIHEQNKVTVMEPGIPAKMSNGVDSKGVCAQKVKLFKVEPKAPVKITSCPPEQNRVMAVTTIPAPSTAMPATNFPTFGTLPPELLRPTMPSVPVGGFITPPVSSGGPPTTPVSGPGGVVPPAGSIPFEVIDIDTEKVHVEPMYQVPGGPRPIGYSMKSKQPYFFIRPGGVIIKSSRKIMEPGYQEARETGLGAAQKPKAEKARQISLAKYPLDRFPIGGAGAGTVRPSVTPVTPMPFTTAPPSVAPSTVAPPTNIPPPFTFTSIGNMLPPAPSVVLPPASTTPVPSLLPGFNPTVTNPVLPPNTGSNPLLPGFIMEGPTTPIFGVTNPILPPASNFPSYGGATVTLNDEDESDEDEDNNYSSENDEEDEIINVPPAINTQAATPLPNNSLFNPLPTMPPTTSLPVPGTPFNNNNFTPTVNPNIFSQPVLPTPSLLTGQPTPTLPTAQTPGVPSNLEDLLRSLNTKK